MHLKILVSAVAIMTVLTPGAGTLYVAHANPSVMTSPGALHVTVARVSGTTMSADGAGIGWD